MSLSQRSLYPPPCHPGATVQSLLWHLKSSVGGVIPLTGLRPDRLEQSAGLVRQGSVGIIPAFVYIWALPTRPREGWPGY